MDSATREAAKIILSCHIKAMRSDLKFGSYSPEMKNIIEDQLNDALNKYKSL